MKKPLATFLSAALLGLAAPSARSEVVLSTLGSANDPTDTFMAPLIGQALVTGSVPIALSSVEFLQSTGVTADETFAVYNRTTSSTIGSLLYGNFSLAHDDATGLTSATVGAPLTLAADSGYFFVLRSNTGQIDWDFTRSTDYVSAFGASLPNFNCVFQATGSVITYYNLDNGPQSFQVNGSAVPEPSTWGLLTVGSLLGGIAALRGRRRRPAMAA